MTNKRTGGRWLVAALAASAVLTSGCAAPVDPDKLPGVYRNKATGSEILLDSDGTFSATDISTDESPDPVDFSGRWEFVDSQTSSDFVSLSVEDGGLGSTAGVQLYPSGRTAVEFRFDPDGPPSLVLTRVTAP
ncbi:hypothetical protein GCM10010406_29870 [Streptomyces thermolineatus]|uniref:Secreted protein n=1 Tax=Streptomyces thermolineatus TaxID=44033 RepID=A0ABP5Z3K2_9ACTN